MKDEIAKLSSRRNALRLLILPVAVAGVVLSQSVRHRAQDADPPAQNHAERVTVTVKQTHKIVFPGAIVSATTADDAIATVEIVGKNTLLILGVDFGETPIIVATENERKILVVEVVGQRITTVAEQKVKLSKLKKSSLDSGSYNVDLAFSTDRGSFVAQQKLNYRRRIGPKKLLKVSGDWAQNFGADERLAILTNPAFQVQTLTVAIETPTANLNLLDSELAVSPLSLNNYPIRGLYLATAENSKFHGIQAFVGTARPVFGFFEASESKIFGVTAPIFTTEKLKLKAAAYLFGSSRESINGVSGGPLLQLLAFYAPNEWLELEGDAQFAKNQLSWRGSFKTDFDKVTLSGEAEFLAANSPLVGIQAQAAGRKQAAAMVSWRPTSRLGFSANFTRGESLSLAGNRRFSPNRQSVFAGVNYRLVDNWQTGARLSRQQTSLNVPNTTLNFNVESTAYSFFLGGSFPKNWRHRLEASFHQSRESENGFSASYEVQRSWNDGSVTGFYNRRESETSPAGLILRNLSILPPTLHGAFVADPAGFLLTYRDLLNQIFPDLDLAASRQTDFGGRLQARLGAWSFYAEARYATSEFNHLQQSGLYLNHTAVWRIDEANTLGVRVANRFFRTVDNSKHSTDVTLSYTHQLGVAGGFQFSRLFSGKKGSTLRGRVFYDRNGNGQIDENERGLAGMKVRFDDNQTVISDANGEFVSKRLPEGTHQIALEIDGLGKLWRASSSLLQAVDLDAAKSAEVNFGLNDHGFLAGRIFNDLNFSGKNRNDFPGIGSVKVRIKPLDEANAPFVLQQTQTTDGGGQYNFRSLPPGDYLLETLPESLPDDYEIPAEMTWIVKVLPVKGFYQDIPLAAQRAIQGMVFIDRNGNNLFDAETDSAIANAKIMIGKKETRSDARGGYLLRNLPAGEIALEAFLPDGTKMQTVMIVLDSQPVFLQNVNLIFANP